MIEQQIEKLRTLQESYDAVATAIETQLPAISDKIDNIDLTPIENKVDEGVSALSTKIENIDLSSVAKQGENQDATNTAIYALLSQFGESVLQEKVTVILNCQESIMWQDYAVSVTFEDGRVQAVPLSENGTCTFSIQIGQNYSVQLPVIGTFIAPTLKTYTAISSSRDIYWSYVLSGVFGLDELGRRYSIEQIEALQDKSIIKYGAYTDEYLENFQKADGSIGCSFMWEMSQSMISKSWASSNVEFSQELLPFITTNEEGLPFCDGEAYTQYIISEGIRLGVTTEAATYCAEQSISIAGKIKKGFFAGYGQVRRLSTAQVFFNALFEACGLTPPNLFQTHLATSCQCSETEAVYMNYGGRYNGVAYNKYGKKPVYVFYPLN